MAQGYLEPVRAQSWKLGLSNIMRIELHRWRALHRWLRFSLSWVLGLEGFVILLATVLPRVVQVMPDETNQVMDPLTMGIQGHFQIGAAATAIGAILIGLGLVYEDRRSGVAEWILAKPVSRAAYYTGKLSVNAACVALLMVGVPSVVAYGVLSLVHGSWLAPLPFCIGTFGLVVHALCYLGLSLMLSVVLKSRGAVLGIMLPSVLLGQLWGMLLGRWVVLTPWGLSASLAGHVLGVDMPAGLFVGSLAASAGWCVAATVAGLMAFRRAEIG